MRTRLVVRLIVLACAAPVAAPGSIGGHREGPYRFSREIAVGGEGGWDYLSTDSAAHRLYVAHDSRIVVIDMQANAVVGEIAGTPGVHGFAIASDLGRGFSSNGRENKIGIVDLAMLKTLRKVDAGENPDAILYEPARREVYAFNGRGRSATVIDARSGAVTATIPLEGKPEFAQVDSRAGRVYVNIEDQNVIKVIDVASRSVAATWPIAPGESASGMAIDVDRHRLFIGCDNKLMLMIDSTNGAVLYAVPIGGGVDSNWFDPGTGFVFSSNGESGTVTIAREESPHELRIVQTLETRRGARTMALDPATHAIYLAATAAAARPLGTTDRPVAAAGTFRILVYRMNGEGPRSSMEGPVLGMGALPWRGSTWWDVPAE